jgi:hypothetical protein
MRLRVRISYRDTFFNETRRHNSPGGFSLGGPLQPREFAVDQLAQALVTPKQFLRPRKVVGSDSLSAFPH